METSSPDVGRRWFVAAGLCAAVTAGALLVLPTSSVQTAGQPVRHETLLAAQGPGVLPLLLVPVLLCVIPLLVLAPRRAVTGWTVFVILTSFATTMLASIGFFFLFPAALLLAVGAARSAPAARRGAAGQPHGGAAGQPHGGAAGQRHGGAAG